MKVSIAGLILGAALAGCREEPEVVEAPTRPVRYQKVVTAGAARERSFAGVAKAGVESLLSFRVRGPVEVLAVKVGDVVKKGQLIARIDASDYRLQVQQARATLAQAEAQERNSRASYDRVRRLYETNNASKSDFDAARAAFESAQAQVEAARQQLALANRQLAYTRLEAPAAGSIASTDVEVGENVLAGQRVALLSGGDDIEVEVGVPEVLIARISKGQLVTVTLDALPGTDLDGVVTEVGVAAVGGATTYPVTIRLLGDMSKVRPGMAAEVRFQFPQAETSYVIVPSFSVRSDRDGPFVFVVEPSGGELGAVRRRPVKIGDVTTGGIEILEGLENGELLVTAGVSRLRDGQEVRVLDEHEVD
jgi:multidrug efflux system membrane fusion protein